MINFVLQRAGEQPGTGDLDLPTEPVLRHYPDLLAARDESDEARDGQAALEVALVTFAANEPRVDQLVDFAADFDDGRLQRDAHLRRGKSDARGCAHRLSQVVEQLVQVLAEG